MKGSIRTIVGIIILTLCSASIPFGWAGGDPPPKPELSREDKLAMQALEALVSIPDPEEKAPHLAYLMKKEVARSIIFDFAAQLKTGQDAYSTTVSREEMRTALQVLNSNIARFADKKYGNSDGKIELPEFDKFLAGTKGLPGIQVMREMFLRH